MNEQDLENIFTYHHPFGNLPGYYESIRNSAKEFAYIINEVCPDSREKSLAITNLQQAVMWANAAIALHSLPSHPPPLDKE